MSSQQNNEPKFSVVTTCYNEQDNVENMIVNLLARFRHSFPGDQFELVVVLNGCLDKTPELARALARDNSEITLVDLAQNHGYGAGIRAGLNAARGELVGYIDGDEQVSAEDVVKVFNAAKISTAEIVKVVRVKREDGVKRLIITSGYNFLFRIFFGSICHDINGKPKILRRTALRQLGLTSNDWFIDAEMMLAAKSLGFEIEEVPVVFKQRAGGQSNVRLATIFEFLGNMFAMRSRLRAKQVGPDDHKPDDNKPGDNKAALPGKKSL